MIIFTIILRIGFIQLY